MPGLSSIPVVDRDEARFAQASRQMLESGSLEGWTVPKVGDRVRLSKPPLIYWAQASSAGVASGGDPSQDAIWMYRLPSVLAAIGTVLLVWHVGRAMFGGATGLLAGAFLAICPVVVFDAHMARADELLVFLTTAAMVMLYTCWRDGRHAGDRLPVWRTSLLWICVGLGMLAKGPITLMIVLLTILVLAAWSRQWHWALRIRPFTGALIVLAVFVPWVVLAANAVGLSTLWEIAYDEVFVRSTTGRESHGAPPGYHLVLLTVLLWPGTLVTGIALGRSWHRARCGGRAGQSLFRRLAGIITHPAHGRGAEAFCLAWLVPSWLVFEIAATKLPHYTLPLYPALALVSARAVLAGAQALPQTKTLGARLGFGLWFVIGLVIVALPFTLLGLAWSLGDLSTPPPGSPRMSGVGTLVLVTLSIGALGGSVLLLIALITIVRGRLLEGQLLAIPSAAIAMALTFGVALPAAWPIWITPRLEHVLQRAGALDGTAPIAAAGFHEDSLVHATRGRLERIGTPSVADWCAQHPGGWVVLPRSAAETLNGLSVVGEVDGYNYSNGKSVDLVVARVNEASR